MAGPCVCLVVDSEHLTGMRPVSANTFQRPYSRETMHS